MLRNTATCGSCFAHQLGFFISGLINNYNFIVVFSCAYSLSQLNPYINPSLIILCEIVPGFLTQLLYTKYLYQIPYTYRWILLYVSQILSSLFLIIQYERLDFLFSSIALVSINSYLGESSMLSLSTYYNHKEMKFWSIGTGLARLCGTGLFLVMNYWLDVRVIFGINLLIYVFGYSLGLYLLNPLKQIEQSKIEIIDISLNTFSLETNETEQFTHPPQKVHPINFIFDIYPLLFAYFTSYFLGFAYIPMLVQNNFEYQLSQFITGVGIFSGRFLGNYIRCEDRFWCSKIIQNIRIFGMVHIYSLLMIIFFTITISLKIMLPFIVLNLMLFVTYFINGLSYPLVYNYIYRKDEYKDEKEWYMGAVGQYTSLFMIIGCLIGYPIQYGFVQNN
jgi:hypothetical protein